MSTRSERIKALIEQSGMSYQDLEKEKVAFSKEQIDLMWKSVDTFPNIKIDEECGRSCHR